ncbi:hypothetical protein RRF57_012764 [Xylaria bambusicola]|uniref:Uncharacterized protein n=1 Tax=Xylaria bambusicola TaxID=326684 RepID=A0AAN7ZB57_9PEZI
MLGLAPVVECGLAYSQSRAWIIQWSSAKFPTKTPVFDPATEAHVSPAFSNASYTTSSSFRCDGSRVSASRPVMLKKAWSNRRGSPSIRNAPSVAIVPGRPESIW